jgi:hypothetical protein
MARKYRSRRRRNSHVRRNPRMSLSMRRINRRNTLSRLVGDRL